MSIRTVFTAPSIDTLAGNGVFDGTNCKPQHFCPEEPLQRWEMAVWLVRVVDGKNPEATETSRFVDIDVSEWWSDYTERLAEMGVTGGCSEEPAFCPTERVSRQQMATLLARAFDLPAASSPAGFADVDPANAHAGSINNLYAAGITKGCSEDPFLYCPDSWITRAQTAALMQRATEWKNQQSNNDSGTIGVDGKNTDNTGGDSNNNVIRNIGFALIAIAAIIAIIMMIKRSQDKDAENEDSQ